MNAGEKRFPYDDIIGHPRHVSADHPQMSMRDRAAQFSPFAALVGYEEAIDETAHPAESRLELGDAEQEELNKQLVDLVSKVVEHPEITVEFAVPDGKKAGISRMTLSGAVRKISSAERTITMQEGQIIKFSDILNLNIKNGGQK